MLRIRPATTDDDLAEFARIISIVTPDEPTSIDEIRWADAVYPGGGRFLASLDETAVGAAGVGRVYMYPPEFDGLWGSVSVLAGYRGRGVGSALLATICDVAREAGKTMLIGRTTPARQDAIEFLDHRGFREYERMKVVRLELQDLALPAVEPPRGVVLSSLAEHPELVPSVYEVAGEVVADIPGDAPQLPDTIEEFRKRDVDRPTLPRDAFMLAIEEATGRVVGYANLQLVPGNPTVAWHGMTGVARAWRGRGLAKALKRATIEWALEHRLEALETANDVVNEPMRAVNRRFGYQPLPDEIEVRGPLWPRRPEQQQQLSVPPPRYATATLEGADR